MEAPVRRRAIVLEDARFVRGMITSVISDLGFDVEAAETAAAAIELVDDFDPDLAVIDLDLGDGPSGFDVVRHIQQWSPWVAMLIITSFRSPRLVDPDVPPLVGITYLVKSDLDSPDQIAAGVTAAIERRSSAQSQYKAHPTITPGQADVLRLLAKGLTNEMIANELHLTPRAAAHATRRLYRELGIDPNSGSNARVVATRMFNEGEVGVRRTPTFGD